MAKRKSTIGHHNTELKTYTNPKIHVKNGGEIKFSGRVNSSCSAGGISRVTLVTNPVMKLWIGKGPEHIGKVFLEKKKNKTKPSQFLWLHPTISLNNSKFGDCWYHLFHWPWNKRLPHIPLALFHIFSYTYNFDSVEWLRTKLSLETLWPNKSAPFPRHCVRYVYVQNTIQKTQDWATQTPLKTGEEPRFSGRVSSLCATSDTYGVTLVTKPMRSHGIGKDREVLTTSRTYLSTCKDGF